MNDETPTPGRQAPTIKQTIERGRQHHMAGDLAKAESLYRRVLQSDPDQPDALHLLGVAAHQAGQNDVAEDLITKALAFKPDGAKLHNNLGLALQGLGELERAIASFQNAIAITPDFPKAHYNLGVALNELGRWGEAAASLRQAVAGDPDFAEAHFSLGKALKERGGLTEALASYRQALAIKPGFAEAHNNIGNVLKRQGELEEAVASYRQAVSIDPGFATAHSNLLLSLNYGSEVTQEEIEQESHAWNARYSPPGGETPRFGNDRSPDRRLRVGYVSPDMREHSVSYFFEPLLAAHDPAEVETFCYADVAKADATTRRLEAHADHWRRTFGIDDAELEELIRVDGIDLLVDLAGHTKANRLPLFARRPSPVQISWLGYPNTTGLAAMDYRFVDAITDPADEGSETLVRLPNGFLCYRPADAAPYCVPVRSGPVTFGSFNNAPKMSRACIDLWSRILNETPDSRLLLKSEPFVDPATRARLCEKFSRHGVGPERLSLLPRSESLAIHLGLYTEIDVCLDPFPYNGTTTTCEALWMGVPVVTLHGEHHRGRVGSSILTRIGLQECVAASPDDYVRIATGLAGDPSRRRDLGSGMRARMAPLCDADAFARDMEAAYRSVWRAWCESPA